MIDLTKFSPDYLRIKVPEIFSIAKEAKSVEELRKNISHYALKKEYQTFDDYGRLAEGSIIRVRDAARVVYCILMQRSEDKSNFSVPNAIRDISLGVTRSDLTPAFYAELLYLFLGLEGRGPGKKLADFHITSSQYQGQQMAKERSKQLDELTGEVNIRTLKYVSGLGKESVVRRDKRRKKILKVFNASVEDWNDWHWQIKNISHDSSKISFIAELTEREKSAIDAAKKARIPFGITPYYASLMDDDTESVRDRSIRAQVIPPPSYIEKMSDHNKTNFGVDFMLEGETSPIDLITRRYPAICILKPFDTCPQICVYCQRNWEIKDAMSPKAMASKKDINAAILWIKQHPSIHEVLITGGDPFAMSDKSLDRILSRVSEIPTIERIRIGSRVLVTMPMRITDELADIIAKYRIQGKRQVAIVTHIQHPYEITPDTALAVEKFRQRGIPVYNQLVYTFYISRRFEAAHLRRILSLIGVEPYYTFNTKGKEETTDYRVPIARLLQEQNEEARLLPGLSRTDEAIYNIPGIGKNYLRRQQDRDLISILPDGRRLYEFHPWEKNVSNIVETYVTDDIPILDYLHRLSEIGEDVYDYETIWYYY
jgi:lysine 2,3-aminomutase